MSDELRLPDELAACEARLAGQPLAASAINRDELLYRAGWAACEAKLRRSTAAIATPATRATDRGTIAVWSAASAALAASLAVGATLLLAPPQQPSAGVEQVAVQAQVTQADAKVANNASPPRIVRSGFDVMSLINRRVASASLWDNVERARQPRPEEPILLPTEASLGFGSSPTATAASLLEELLPTSLRRAPAEPGDAPGTNSGDQAI